MTQPTAYNRIASFSNLQALAPSDPPPGGTIDAEFNAVKVTLDQILANLELIQRDDGDLADESVGRDQLAPDLEVGFNAPEVWVTATVYAAGTDTVFRGSAFYRCLVDHTAGTFATDLAAGKWELIVDLSTLTLASAENIAFTPVGGIAATNLQAALAELDAEKAATSHTHTASAISDSTADGRALLVASNVAAQQALLGLGDLAFLDTVAVDEIEEDLAFTGVIEPAALSATTNNWLPTGLATCSTILVSSSSAVTITGLTAPAVDGTIKFIENVGTFPVTLNGEHTSSTAANRFGFNRNVVLQPKETATIKYDADATTPRWRLMSAQSGLPRSYLAGFQLSNNATDTTNDINVARGQCRDQSDSVDLITTSTFIKKLDATFAEGGNEGMRAGGLANGTYHIYVIGKGEGTADILAYSGTDPTAVMPSGYAYWRRVGSILRSGAAIVGFQQNGDSFELDVPVLDVDEANSAVVAFATLTVPNGLKVEAIMNAYLEGNSDAAWLYVMNPAITASSPSETVSPLNSIGFDYDGAGSAVAKVSGQLRCRTNTSQQIRVDGRGAGTQTRRIVTMGWIDRRGRDD